MREVLFYMSVGWVSLISVGCDSGEDATPQAESGVMMTAGSTSDAGDQAGTDSSAGVESPAGTETPAGTGVPSGIDAPAGAESPAGIETPAGTEAQAGVESPAGAEGGEGAPSGVEAGDEMSAGDTAGVESPGGGEGGMEMGGMEMGGMEMGGAPPSCDPACEGNEVCFNGACGTYLTGVMGIDGVLFGPDETFDTEILRAQDPDMSWRPSRIYKWRDFARAVASMHAPGVGDMRLWLGDEGAEDEVRAQYALVNLAAFLAQSMKETIKYDACDENNWDNSNNYQISNACGQLGQNYANYDCDMACPQNPAMTQYASTNATWYGAPGPFFCAPDDTLRDLGLLTADGRTGYWNYNHDCWPYPATEANFTPADEPAYSRAECEVYEGQRGGRWEWDGSGGSVEGCCWWGRGVIQTTGRCNFGILNHYLGSGHLNAADHPRPAQVLYPELDFCADPDLICREGAYPELKWIAGLFYWMSSVQSYDEAGWSYLQELRAFVDGGMNGYAFIDAVSGIVNRGCHNPPCSTGAVDGVADRRANFDAVLSAMGLR